jgi:surface polysaccharide O-acyltransferase-like enzyme
MPLLSCLSEPKYRHILKYLILVMFIFQSTIMPLCKLIGIDWNSKFALPVDSYLIFVLLGYYLSTANISKSTRYKLYLSGICGAVIRYSAILILSTRDGTKNTLFFNYGYFPSIMLACAVFVLMKSLNWEKILERLHIRPAMVTKISSYSLGIYLIHRIVMYYELLVLGKFGYTNAWVGWRTFAILGTYLIALVIVAVIKRIPFLNKIIP